MGKLLNDDLLHLVASNISNISKPLDGSVFFNYTASAGVLVIRIDEPEGIRLVDVVGAEDWLALHYGHAILKEAAKLNRLPYIM